MILIDKYGEQLDIGFNPNWFEYDDEDSDKNEKIYKFDFDKALTTHYNFLFHKDLFSDEIYLVVYDKNDASIVALPLYEDVDISQTGMECQIYDVILSELEIKTLKKIK
jgi:hypothetical protein